MSLLKFHCKNFRNLEEQIFVFHENLNCIFGENGHGKTNLLEAIYFSLYKKSFRKNASFPQILSMDCGESEIIFSGLFNNINSINAQTHISQKITQDNSEIYINGLKSKYKTVHNLDAVFINPFDSYLFYQSPGDRRKWFDHYLSVYDNDYKKQLTRYQNYQKFKNTLLQKKPSQYLAQIKAVIPEMAKLNYELMEKRLIFIRELEKLQNSNFKAIFDINFELKLSYEGKLLGLSLNDIEKAILNNLPKDEILGRSELGIHRDLIHVHMNGLNCADFSSLGQQKMSYLSLLFAYIELFRYKNRTYPIVLIDDVSGELDQVRWSYLVAYLSQNSYQVILTTANEKFKEELLKLNNIKLINILQGKAVTPVY